MLCKNSDAAQLAKLLISGFPNSQINEPEYYIAQLVSVFCEFDYALVQRSCSPSRGIPSDFPTFLPSIGEVQKWLEKQVSSGPRKIPSIEEQLGGWINRMPTEKLKKMGRDWLDRTDPIAQQVSGQKPTPNARALAAKKLIEEFGKDAFDAVPDRIS